MSVRPTVLYTRCTNPLVSTRSGVLAIYAARPGISHTGNNTRCRPCLFAKPARAAVTLDKLSGSGAIKDSGTVVVIAAWTGLKAASTATELISKA